MTTDEGIPLVVAGCRVWKERKIAGVTKQGVGGLGRLGGEGVDRVQRGGRFGGSVTCKILTPFPSLIQLHRLMWTVTSNIAVTGPS